MSKIKQKRAAERVKIILSELLLREVADPLLTHITITEVKLDPELMFADVYVNALGDEDRHKDVMRGLERAQGFLRREVGKRLALRHAPELHFHWDATLERSEHINRLIASLDIPPDDAPAPQTAPDDQPDELA